MNRYAFERNNPYRYTDEDGHEPKKSPKGNIFASIAEGTIRAGTETIRQITYEKKELITFDESKRVDYGKVFDAFLDAFRLPGQKEEEDDDEDEADKSKVKTYEVYVVTNNPSPPTIAQQYKQGTDIMTRTINSVGSSLRSFVRYVSTITENILDWYGRTNTRPKGEEYVEAGVSGGGGSSGGSRPIRDSWARETDDGRWVCGSCDDQGFG